MLGVVITAAGSGQRFGGEIPKQYQELCGQSVLSHSLARFLQHPMVAHIVVVIAEGHCDFYETTLKSIDVVAHPKMLKPVLGAATRQASVKQGLLALKDTGIDQVLIHDAARPLVTDKLIDDLSGGLKKAPGAVPILPPVDSLKMIDWANERLVSTLPRAEIGRVRTPQAFDFETIIGLHEQMEGENLPDDAELLLKAGLDVTLVACSEALIKVTVKEDLEILSALIQKDSPNYEYRSGIGFDVHAFDEQTDRPLVLCGVKFENHRPLKGHSDADVALHTITDALLGAIAEGDIGTHFPPSEAKWKGMDSAVFLEHAVTLVNERHGKITSVDLTVICESPKVTPRRQEMRERLAEIMKLNINRVSVKGTTTEKLGFAGRGEGIAAQASVTVALPLERSL